MLSNRQNGQLLVELLVVIGLFAVLAPVLLTSYISSIAGKAQQKERAEAITLLKESEEAVRTIREENWEYLTPLNSDLHVQRTGNTWQLAPLEESFGNFKRKIVLTEVYRDSTGLIIDSGTADQIDPSILRVDFTVSWEKPIPSSVDSTLYLSRYLENSFVVDTTEGDFNNGTSIAVNITNTDGGEFELGQGGLADWCAPGNPIVSHNFPGNGGADNGIAGNVVAGTGYAYAGTGGNASSYPFYSIKIDSSVFPPSIDLIAHYDAPGLKANDVFGVDNYAYISPDSNTTEEVLILDLSGASPSLLGYVNISGTKGSKTLFVSGNYLYFVGFNDKLYVYDITNKAAPVSVGNITVGDARKIYVVGNYIYIAMNSTSNQLKILDATDKSSLAIASTLTINDSIGMDVFGRSYFNGDGDLEMRAYFITQISATANNFYIVNTTDPENPEIIDPGYNTNTMNPRGITVIDERAIIVGENRPQYQVVIVEEDEYNWCASIPKEGDPDIANYNDVSSIKVDDHAYSYLVSSDTENAFQIIEGGLGDGGTYVASGEFESQPVDLAGKEVALNHFFMSYDKPTDTDVRFQVAGADPGPTSCSDAIYTFVGPDLTASTFYDADGYIPWDNDGEGFENPAQCFKYKAYLTTDDTNVTPVVFDLTINYSP